MASSASALPRSGGSATARTGNAGPAGSSVVETGSRRMLVVIGVMLAALLQTLDSTITNVALPNIQGNLGASTDEGTWVINGYIIAVVIVIPMIPWLQTTFGRKRYFLACIAGFTAASFACGISTSIDELIVFRIVQGVFGAGLLATAQTILRDTFPPEQLGVSQGIFALGAIMGPALGPPLGGVLVDNLNWNWVFDINVVPGVASFLILLAVLRDPASAKRQPIDLPGLIFLVIGIGCLQYVLSEGERYDWFSDQNNLIDGVLAAIFITLLVWRELTTRNPLVDLRVFRHRAVSAGFVCALVIGGLIFGSTYTIPQFVQGSLDFTATLSGLLIFVRAIPIGIATPWVARNVGKYDARAFIGVGFVFMGLGNALQAFVTAPNAVFSSFVVPLALTGVGAACLFVPLSTAVLGGAPQQDSAKAAAYVNLGTQLGGSIAIALLSTILDRRIAFHLSVFAGNVTLNAPVLQLHPQLARMPQELYGLVFSQALIAAYEDISLVLASLAIVAIPVAFLMPRPRKGTAPAHVEA
ncbi:MAG TPA: DHA2 family efflux MFS transporter permease subunit [Candidatus Sulfotelmatobacter sp.]|nr:DHA2 family efflux MFS transporter permease subunit [Candidatus Sulfotelmatobacter sp.]